MDSNDMRILTEFTVRPAIHDDEYSLGNPMRRTVERTKQIFERK